MENKNIKKNYRNLPLEEIVKEYDSCFDENDNIIDQEKFAEVIENPEIRKRIFSKEQLVRNASQEEDLLLKGASERFLGNSFPPSWHWEMPDSYYPGFYVDKMPTSPTPEMFNSLGNYMKITSTLTRNDAVLKDCGWERKEYDTQEYYNADFPNIKLSFDSSNDCVVVIKFDPETNQEISKAQVPFSLLCGLFLKCRELNFKKPWQLRAHDYKNRRPDVFEETRKIVRDQETHEIIDYGTWNPDKE